MNGHQNDAFSCLNEPLKRPRNVNGYGADYATTSKISNGFYDYYLNSEYYYSGILNLILDVENGNASFEVEYEYELTHYTTIENKRYKKKDSYEIKGMYRDQPTLIINSGTPYYGTWR